MGQRGSVAALFDMSEILRSCNFRSLLLTTLLLEKQE